MAQPNRKYKNWTTNKAHFEEGNDLSWLQPMYSFAVSRDTQCDASEHTETGNGNHVCIVIQLCIAVATLCFCCDFSTLLYHSAKLKSHI